MSESEKTPREIGEQAKNLYHKHKNASWQLEGFKNLIDSSIESAQFQNGMALAKEEGQDSYKGESLAMHTSEEMRDWRDNNLKLLGDVVLLQGLAKDKYETNLSEATQHYNNDAATYHDLAVAEASLDGVRINVSQAQEAPEIVKVEVRSPEK